MRKLTASIRTLDQLIEGDYQLAVEDTPGIVADCRRALFEAGHAEHAESLDTADPVAARDGLRAIVARISTPDTLTPPQVAKRYGVSADTVRTWIQSGQLKATNLSKAGRPRYKVTSQALDEFNKVRAVQECPKVERRRKPAKDYF